jgi:hypothetical protein
MNNFNNNLSVQTYNEVGVQTESLTIFNTESTIDLPESTYVDTNIQTNVLPDGSHVNAEVQTKSLWKLFKKTLKNLFCINDSDISANDVINESDIPANDVINESDISANDVISDSDISANDVISESSESGAQELLRTYDIMDDLDFAEAISQTKAILEHILMDGIDQYFISYSDTILSVNPDLINLFL